MADIFVRMLNKMEKRMDKAILKDGQKEVFVIYSAYDTDEEDNPIDNLDEIAAKGKVILFAKTEEFWGGDEGKDYESPILTNPTWLDVCLYANRMIKTTNDHHHVFLEGLTKSRRKSPIGVTYYEFSMGS